MRRRSRPRSPPSRDPSSGRTRPSPASPIRGEGRASQTRRSLVEPARLAGRLHGGARVHAGGLRPPRAALAGRLRLRPAEVRARSDRGARGTQGRGRGRSRMLAEARAALAIEHPRAQIGILSAYRSAVTAVHDLAGQEPEGQGQGQRLPVLLPGGDKPRASSARATSAPTRRTRSPATSAGTSPRPATATTRTASRSTSAIGRGRQGPRQAPGGLWFHRWLKTTRSASTSTRWPPRRGTGRTTRRRPSEVWAGEVEPATPVSCGQGRGRARPAARPAPREAHPT